ncbi:hypothetical protein C7964_102206 [Loktanella sp. PT4BL]|jgi:hypothetical protein|uniref:hypothetical protein n=1 Tax=Loktanella sp. PT4BL TaxID=2135611 RepID=UPI000D756AEA|nr:hypothetical protein [Loktanella sp. PT4BL]PXW70321.1 hypothetical protein C7964_102206 [Loktanella sp. PT4BL]
MKISKRQPAAAYSEAGIKLADRTLVIGNLARWSAEGRMVVPFEDVHFIDLCNLTEELLEAFDPDLILSPLFAGGFDVLDVAQRLVALGYQGRYRAISDNMPDVAMILKEVRTQAEGLDFDLLSLPPPCQK